MSTKNERYVDPGEERLTRICARVLKAVEADPEFGDDVKMILMLDDGKKGGIVAHGYDDPTSLDPMVDLLGHIRAMFRAQGKDLIFKTLDEVYQPGPN